MSGFSAQISDNRKNPHIGLDHPRCGFFYISFEKSLLTIRVFFIVCQFSSDLFEWYVTCSLFVSLDKQ